MSIDQLSILLDEIQGYVQEYKNLKEENEQLKAQMEEYNNLNQENVELKAQVETLKTQIIELQVQADLNLAKAKEIVDELKVIINA